MMPIDKRYILKTKCEICFNNYSKGVNSMLNFKVNNTLGKKILNPLHHCRRQDMVNNTLRTTDSMESRKVPRIIFIFYYILWSNIKMSYPKKTFPFLFYFHDTIIIIVSAQNCKSLVKIFYILKYNNNKGVPCGFPDDSTLSSLNRF